MKLPRAILVVDASVLIAMARGRATRAVERVSEHCQLVISDTAIREARRRIELGMKRPELLDIIDALVQDIFVIPAEALEQNLELAQTVLRDAVASRNGSTNDAHILACAWAVDGDIWSFDRDFAGTGVASWTTANLMHALA